MKHLIAALGLLVSLTASVHAENSTAPYIVEPGDGLYDLFTEYFGYYPTHGELREYAATQGIENIDHIEVGWVIQLPVRNRETVAGESVAQVSPTTHINTVSDGKRTVVVKTQTEALAEEGNTITFKGTTEHVASYVPEMAGGADPKPREFEAEDSQPNLSTYTDDPDGRVALQNAELATTQKSLDEANAKVVLRDKTIEDVTRQRDGAGRTAATLRDELARVKPKPWWYAPFWWIVVVLVGAAFTFREFTRPTRDGLEGEIEARVGREKERLKDKFMLKERDMHDRVNALETQLQEFNDSNMEIRKLHLDPPLFTRNGKVPRVRVMDELVPCVVSTNRMVKFENYTESHLKKCRNCRERLGIEYHEGWYAEQGAPVERDKPVLVS